MAVRAAQTSSRWCGTLTVTATTSTHGWVTRRQVLRPGSEIGFVERRIEQPARAHGLDVLVFAQQAGQHLIHVQLSADRVEAAIALVIHPDLLVLTQVGCDVTDPIMQRRAVQAGGVRATVAVLQ